MKKLIKHFIDMAEGFSIGVMTCDLGITFEGRHYSLEDDKTIHTRLFSKIIYPLFLHRVRIGINKRYQDNCEEGVSIDMSSASIGVWSIAEDGLYREAPFWFVDNDNSEEKTLVAALTWIMEQEEEAK